MEALLFTWGYRSRVSTAFYPGLWKHYILPGVIEAGLVLLFTQVMEAGLALLLLC